MFTAFNDRLTASVIRILTAAQAKSDERGESAVDVSDIVYGLLSTPGTLAHHILIKLGMEPRAAEETTDRNLIIKPLNTPTIEFTGAAESVLSKAVEIAGELGDRAVGSEHLLISIAESQPVYVSAGFGHDVATVHAIRQEVVALKPTRHERRDYDPEIAFASRMADVDLWREGAYAVREIVAAFRTANRNKPGSVVVERSRMALRSDPTNYALRIAIADILSECGELDEAMSNAAIAIAINQDMPIAYRRLALTATALGLDALCAMVLDTGWSKYKAYASEAHMDEDREFWFGASVPRSGG